ERELVYKNEDRISGFDFDHKDRIRLAVRTKSDGSTEILRFNDGKFTPCYECSFEESCYVAAFHKDNKHVYMVTNKGDRDLTELVLFNPETGEEEFVEKDPENEVDFGGLFMSDISKEIILTSYTGDKTRLYFKDDMYEKDYEWLKDELPGVEIGLGSRTEDENKWLVYANSDVDPGAAYLFDREKRELSFQYRPRPNLPTEDLCEMIPVRYASTDGLEIPAYLTLPKGVEPKNLPVVMFIHGGPWARDYWGYDSYAQFLANRGYAVLQPNFRSSTGFGKDFLNAGNGEWGELMQDDISTGVQYLIDEGIADPDRVAIMGGSYGGYATLAGLTFTPDIYAAGVSLVGPSNLITLLESIPPYWEAGRVIMYKRMANPETEEGKAKLMKQSPLNSVQNIKAPLLVVQGANDPRVKQAESDQIVVAMRESELPVEYLVAENEGHGFRNPDNQLAFAATAEKFLAEHIGGRYQKEVRPEIAETIEKLTVDINTVKMPEKLSEEEMDQELPTLNYDVKPHQLNYNMNISMGGQELSMQVDRSVEVMNDKVKITSNVQSPMMNMTEELLLNADMTPVTKSIEQGPVTMNFDYKENMVKGLMNMNGQEKEMMTPLDNAVWDDNAGLYLALSQLKLEEGQQQVLRVYDGQNNKVKNIKMTVVGMEKVEVPAGNFDTYHVELKDMEEDSTKTVFINADDKNRTVVKVNSTIKQMGGAKAVLELTSMN
ncbi:MAG TPA: alpha/beta fold hydrolase, partial [Saprospiraceae bacterium]|nr:alpha/beta fold hydrolase [Saprospiraceae bacterium]